MEEKKNSKCEPPGTTSHGFERKRTLGRMKVVEYKQCQTRLVNLIKPRAASPTGPAGLSIVGGLSMRWGIGSFGHWLVRRC